MGFTFHKVSLDVLLEPMLDVKASLCLLDTMTTFGGWSLATERQSLKLSSHHEF